MAKYSRARNIIHLRHGAVNPQKAALSQKAINAMTHKRHGTLSLTLRMLVESGDDGMEAFEASLSICELVILCVS